MTEIEKTAPLELAQIDLRPCGPVHPSPRDWRDQFFYFLLPDRFSDGQEATRPRFDRADPARYRAPDRRAWMDSGKTFQGGTLRGVIAKLDYLRDLGITALWVGPVWKQRADLQTYHGYAIQNFLEVDPRFGTRRDLRDLVDAAHARGMYVVLDIIINHTANNFFYDDNGHPRDTMPYRFQPPYPIYGWRSATGQPTRTIDDLEDGVWPREFQNPDWYTRAGSIGAWDSFSWEDPLHPLTEFRRGDFFELKDLELTRSDVLNAVIKVYMYWLLLSDCDGFRIDTIKHVPFAASKAFCGAIRECAESIGKDNFLLLGEVTGGEYLKRSYLEVFGRNLDAILDIGEARARLINLAKGLGSPRHYFDQFQSHDLLGSHRQVGRYHVSVIDDHDMVGAPKKARFAAGLNIERRDHQIAHAVGVMLTTLGIPCLYYGTEQAFDGSQDLHDYRLDPASGYEDRYIREAMFGATFGAYQTSGCHFFDPDHPVYVRISALARVFHRQDKIGLTLRRGRQYLREIARDGGGFGCPEAGDLVGWSRVMFFDEVLVVLNSHGLERRTGYVALDSTLHPPGSLLRIFYDGDWDEATLRLPPDQLPDRTLPVVAREGRSAVLVDLLPSGMLILG